MQSRVVVKLGLGFNSVTGRLAESAIPVQYAHLDKKKASFDAAKKDSTSSSSPTSDQFQVVVNMPPSFFQKTPAVEMGAEKPSAALSKKKTRFTLARETDSSEGSPRPSSPSYQALDSAPSHEEGSRADEEDVGRDNLLQSTYAARAYRVKDKRVMCDMHLTTSLVELE